MSQPRVDLFRLELLLRGLDTTVDSQHRSTILLSQIKSLDRALVTQLERSGIYDTDDFLSTVDDIAAFLGIAEDEFVRLHQQIERAIQNSGRQPRVIMDLPPNFALITAHVLPSRLFLGLLWNGLQVVLERPREDSWGSIKEQLDGLLDRMGQPELIGRISVRQPPHWLEEITPLSTYLAQIPPQRDILDIALDWGLPLDRIEIYGRGEQDLLALGYLLHLATK